MGFPSRLFALPCSLLILITTAANTAPPSALQWPHNLPDEAKYFPEHEALVRRGMQAQEKLQTQKVVGVRKMGGDPGEKFFLDYWSFEPDDWNSDPTLYTNQSISRVFDNSFPIHEEQSDSPSILPRFLNPRRFTPFHKRDFQCPSGTNACTSINRPNSCCTSGSTCQLIQDTGLGDVGCCPAGQICAGSLSTCPSGYSACPNNPGGGCCLPGYGCFDVGCVQTATATLIVNPTPTPRASTTTETLTVIVTPTLPSAGTSTITVTTIRTISPASPTMTITTTTTTSTTSNHPSSSLPCAAGFRSCPASLGGGCCRTDRDCGSVNCPATSTSGSLEPPARPTTAVTTTKTARVSSSTIINGCPTGFYACSAYYQGGCCQIGRNCGMTSCPTSASTVLVNSNGITVIAPTGSGITAPGSLLTGACAAGWSTCDPGVGGGCCPTGYACGTSCTATASGAGGNTVGKLAPNDARSSREPGNLCVLLPLCLLSMALGGWGLLG